MYPKRKDSESENYSKLTENESMLLIVKLIRQVSILYSALAIVSGILPDTVSTSAENTNSVFFGSDDIEVSAVLDDAFCGFEQTELPRKR